MYCHYVLDLVSVKFLLELVLGTIMSIKSKADSAFGFDVEKNRCVLIII